MTAKGIEAARAEAADEILGLLTGHELYKYRPKAFQGFIDYVRESFSTSTLPIAGEGKVRPLTCQCENSITDPCIVCGKPKTLVTAEWVTKMVEREGDLDPTTGIPSSPGKDGGQEVEAVAWRRERDGWLNDQGLGVPLYTHPPHQITVDGELVEPVARAIWNVRREEEDRCDMELEDMGEDHSVWAEARAVLSALSTFQPASTALVEAPSPQSTVDARVREDHSNG